MIEKRGEELGDEKSENWREGDQSKWKDHERGEAKGPMQTSNILQCKQTVAQ